MRYLITYDISDDDTRAKAAALLSRHGVRQQLSVFLCEIDEPTLEALLGTLRAMISERSDVLQVFRQCTDCYEGRRGFGQVHDELDSLMWVV